MRGRKDTDVLFEESQIGYMPEGFEKVEEEITFSLVYFKYKNSEGDYITIRVGRDKTALQIDNEEIGKDVYLNAAGYEYTITHKDELYKDVIIWKDENDIYYYLASTMETTELVDIMNSISY